MTLEELEKEYPPQVEVFKVEKREVGSVKPRPPWPTNRSSFMVTLRVRYAYWVIDPNTQKPFSCDEFIVKSVYAIDELDALKTAMEYFCNPQDLGKIKYDLVSLRNIKQLALKRQHNNVTRTGYSTLFKQPRKVRK